MLTVFHYYCPPCCLHFPLLPACTPPWATCTLRRDTSSLPSPFPSPSGGCLYCTGLGIRHLTWQGRVCSRVRPPGLLWELLMPTAHTRMPLHPAAALAPRMGPCLPTRFCILSWNTFLQRSPPHPLGLWLPALCRSGRIPPTTDSCNGICLVIFRLCSRRRR